MGQTVEVQRIKLWVIVTCSYSVNVFVVHTDCSVGYREKTDMHFKNPIMFVFHFSLQEFLFL